MTAFLFLLFASALILIFGAGLGCAVAVLTGLANASRAPRDQKRSEEKGLSLLRSWLSPEQAELWDSHRQFYVVGSDTGTRYRIRYGTAMNIEELDSGGKAIAQWCFAPQGRLVVGDVLLAQKIALETMERKALAAANRQGYSAAWCHFGNMPANGVHSLAVSRHQCHHEVEARAAAYSSSFRSARNVSRSR